MIDTSIFTQNASRLSPEAPRTRIAIALFCLFFAFALSGCTHEPEIATPPAEDAQQTQSTTGQDEANASSDTAEDGQANNDASNSDDSTKDEESDSAAEAKATHEGPFVVSILNAGGADGLAGKAQETLASDGIEGDGYTISVDSYLGGTIAKTTVYVTGEGDDAEAVKAEAEKIAESLGGTVKTYKDGELAEGTTMDGLDILVLVGADAA